MANGHGSATVHFAAAPQAAVVATTQVVSYTPNAVEYQGVNAGGLVSVTLNVSVDWSQVSYGNGMYMVVANNYNSAATSTNGVNWGLVALPATSDWRITFGAGVFLIMDTVNAMPYTSVNGISWAAGAMPSPESWFEFVYGNGVFVAVAYSSLKSAVSTDGLTWVEYPNLPAFGYWWSIAFINGIFSTRIDATADYCTSTDGINWTAHVYPTAANYSNISFGGGLYVVAANNGPTYYSTDYVTWTQGGSIGNNCREVVYGDGIFAAVCSFTDQMYISENGVDWVATSFGPSENWRAMTFGNHAFIYVGSMMTRAALWVYRNSFTPTTRTVTNINTETSPAKSVVGSNVATVTVTGQATLLATDSVEAWIQGSDSTADHNAYEHAIKPFKCKISNVVAGVGFDILALTDKRLDGDFKVRWAWAS